MKYTLFIFRRDYRVVDNNGLIWASEKCKNIIPIFIFTPEQVTNKNKFKSDNAIQFMIESLKDLNKELVKLKSKLHIFYGDNVDILKKICKEIQVTDIVFNMDYTPYALKRDKKIKVFCEENDIKIKMTEDYLLSYIGRYLKSDRTPYVVYNGFRNNAVKFSVRKPNNITVGNFKKSNKLKKLENGYIEYTENEHILLKGGRIKGLEKLKAIKNIKNYDEDRNTLAIETTQLSAYIKFGCISIREVYYKFVEIFGKESQIINQLYWRELYYYINYYFPRVVKRKRF